MHWTGKMVTMLTIVLLEWQSTSAWAQDQTAIIDPPLAIGVGELRLEGKITGVDVEKKTLTLEATSFVLFNGKTGRIATPKPKTVKLGDKVLLYARGTLDEKLTIAGVQVGLFASVVGRDGGTGQPMAARTVALWKTERDGKFQLGEATKNTPPVDEKAATPITAKPKLPINNEIENGNFETVGDNQKLEGWASGQGSSIVEDDEGNHYVLLKATGDIEARLLTQEVLLAPQWKTLKVTARVRGRGLQLGKNPWEVARIRVDYFNAKNELLPYTNGSPVTLTFDSDWVVKSGISLITTGAHHAMLAIGNSGVDGEFGVDDVIVEPDGAIDAPLLRPNFPEGTFEQPDAEGNLPGWPIKGVLGVELIEENGNHFLRLTNTSRVNVVGMDSFWKLDPDVRIVRIRARLRGRDIKTGKQPWENARLSYSFVDDAGAKVGDWPPVLEMKEDTDWQKQTRAANIPPGAVFLKLTPQLLNASGILDIDDIQIEQMK